MNEERKQREGIGKATHIVSASCRYNIDCTQAASSALVRFAVVGASGRPTARRRVRKRQQMGGEREKKSNREKRTKERTAKKLTAHTGEVNPLLWNLSIRAAAAPQPPYHGQPVRKDGNK
jgi:hypothetical protein